MSFSRELRLALDCCQWNFRGPHRSLVAVDRIDWPVFLRLVRFHRIQGLVWKCLAKNTLALPQAVSNALATDAQGIAAANLRAMVDCRELLQLFDRAGAELLFLKGLPLGMLAYGNSTAKASFDIDVLIDGRQLERCAEILRDGGFELADPRVGHDPASIRTAYRFRKAFEWVRPDGSSRIDVHDRPSDHRLLIPDIGVRSPRQSVEVTPGLRLPTLADEELFAHLCVHGASSAWFRLKWITDLAALIAPLEPVAIDHLYSRSQVLGAGRAAGQALLLADRLFGSLAHAPQLREKLSASAATRILAAAALKQVAGRSEPREPTSRPWRTLRIHWTQLLLLPGAKYQWSELSRQVAAALMGRL